MFRLRTKLLDEPTSRGHGRRGCGAGVAHATALIGLIVALWLGAASAWAQVWTVPPGLNPGDKYRLVFITDLTEQAISSNIANYNTFVTNQAKLNTDLDHLATTWKAIASTATVSARENTSTAGSGVPIYRFVYDDGKYTSVKVADDYNQLWGGAIQSPIRTNQYGVTLTEGFSVWTGTTLNGSSDGAQSLGASSQVRIGWGDKSDGKWIYDLGKVSSESRRFYAISGELTAVPEPGSLALGFALALAGAAWGVRRRNRKAEPSASTASF